MNEFMTKFQKAMRDEISAAIVYIKMANSLKGFQGSKIAEELLEHSAEEFEHYNELVSFAAKHGLTTMLDFNDIDMDVIKNAPLNDDTAVLTYTQELEATAISDYKKLVELATEEKSEEAKKFFSEIMSDEINHFDELAEWTGQTRPCKLAQENSDD